MAYKKGELEAKALKAIKKHNLLCIEDVVACLPCDKTTFYRKKCHENNAIKEALESNRIDVKTHLRQFWQFNERANASERIALYKLAANQTELDALTVNKNVNEEKKDTAPPPIEWLDNPDDE